jgi:signal transduction histidine kinase
MTSAATIATVTEKTLSTFTPERYRLGASEPAWGSDRRREQAETLRRDELAVSRALKKHAIKEQLISVQHPRDAVEMILATSAAPVLDSGGHLAGAILFTENVTNEMLLDGQRDAILAMAGHDLRNPLTPAKALLQQLRLRLYRDGNFPKEIGYIDRVLDQLLRIESLAADLDAVAANGRGDVTAAMATADLVRLCEEVARKQMERNPAIAVAVRANADQINSVLAKKHLERALAMLVDSAARRSPPGRQVTVRLKQLRNEVRIEIADAGEAFAPDRLDALRAVLRRGAAALALTQGGDLDLSTIQAILGLYRSRLHVDSKARQGNTFWFELPAPLPDPAETP